MDDTNDNKRQGRSTIAALLLADGRPCLSSHSRGHGRTLTVGRAATRCPGPCAARPGRSPGHLNVLQVQPTPHNAANAEDGDPAHVEPCPIGAGAPPVPLGPPVSPSSPSGALGLEVGHADKDLGPVLPGLLAAHDAGRDARLLAAVLGVKAGDEAVQVVAVLGARSRSNTSGTNNLAS